MIRFSLNPKILNFPHQSRVFSLYKIYVFNFNLIYIHILIFFFLTFVLSYLNIWHWYKHIVKFKIRIYFETCEQPQSLHHKSVICIIQYLYLIEQLDVNKYNLGNVCIYNDSNFCTPRKKTYFLIMTKFLQLLFWVSSTTNYQ